MRNTDEEATKWNRHVGGDLPMNRVTELQVMLHHNHDYVSIFKYTFDNIYLPDYNKAIRKNTKPAREHEYYHIAPSVDEVVIIVINQQDGKRTL